MNMVSINSDVHGVLNIFLSVLEKERHESSRQPAFDKGNTVDRSLASYLRSVRGAPVVHRLVTRHWLARAARRHFDVTIFRARPVPSFMWMPYPLPPSQVHVSLQPCHSLQFTNVFFLYNVCETSVQTCHVHCVSRPRNTASASGGMNDLGDNDCAGDCCLCSTALCRMIKDHRRFCIIHKSCPHLYLSDSVLLIRALQVMCACGLLPQIELRVLLKKRKNDVKSSRPQGTKRLMLQVVTFVRSAY